MANQAPLENGSSTKRHKSKDITGEDGEKDHTCLIKEKVDTSKENIKSTNVIEIQPSPPRRLIYQLTDTPPFHFLILFAFQQAFLALSAPLGTTLIVAQAVCAQDEEVIKVRLLGSALLMMGVATFSMTTFGLRLPVFQGPGSMYIIPLLALASLDEYRCPETFEVRDGVMNKTVLMARLDNNNTVLNSEVVTSRINAYAGSLMAIGALHFLTGFTGLVGVLARYIGPITIVPVISLFAIFGQSIVVSFCETYWPIAILTSGTCILLGLFLANRKTPIPVWAPSRGFFIVWQPVQQYFSLLISLAVGWIVSHIITVCGVLTDDKGNKEYNARTDARIHMVHETAWFVLPYPFQFGMPQFNTGAFITFLVATLISLLDSIGDYNATARITYAPPPPVFAVNRGIAVEGIMATLSGALGCSQATLSYGSNIGLMGLTRVASRRVFQVVGIIYIFMAVIGKIGAFFISIPYSVMGGVQFITFGLFFGMILSYLQHIDLNSNRNLSILGMALLLGVMVPTYIKQDPTIINTGSTDGDNILKLLLSNPSFIGGFFAFVLDNTVSGTKKERGISIQIEELEAFEKEEKSELIKKTQDENLTHYETGPEVYRLPFISTRFRQSAVARYIPLFYIEPKSNGKQK